MSSNFFISSNFFTSLFNKKAKKNTVKDEAISIVYDSDYQKITARDIATANGIEYISNARGSKVISNEDFVNRFYAKKGRYILLHPANDGMPTCPIEWYGVFDGKTKMIMDNQTSFKCITNLSDIIIKMISLYSEYIDDEIFINPSGFAIRFDDEVKPKYTGRASLVLTDCAVMNKKVKPEQIDEAKMYFLNEFLDHFIGWNFGVVIKNNPELEERLIKFNDLVISKGLRKDAGPGFDVWCTDDVQHYKMKTA